MSEPLRIREIKVRRMPGISPPGFEVKDLGEGITVLHGPNESGKTTLARAISSVLWPDHAPDHAEVRAQATIGTEDYTFDLKGTTASYQKGGVPTERPLLPPPQTRDRAVLTLPELLRKTESDDVLAKAVLEGSKGGYNPLESAKNLKFESVSPRTGQVTRDLEDARKRLSKRQERARGTRSQEEDLGLLRKRRQEAAQAREELDLLADAKKHAKRLETEHEAKRALDDFPSELEHFDGNEVKRLEEIDEHLTQAHSDATDAKGQIEKAETALEEAGLPEAGVPDRELDTIDNHLETLQDRAEEVKRLEREIEGAKEERRDAEARLDGDVDREELSRIGREENRELENLTREVGELEAQREALDARATVLGEAQETSDPEIIRQGLTHLSAWLRSAGAQPDTDQATRLIGPLAAAVIAGLSILLGLSWNWIVGGLGLALGLVIVVLSFWWSRGSEAHDATAVHRQEYVRLDLDPPTAWDPEAVSSRMEDLSDALAMAKSEEKLREEREKIESGRRKLEEREKELGNKRESLSKRLALPLQGSKGELRWLSEALSAWRDSHATIQGLEGEMTAAREQRDEALDEINDHLAEYEYEPAGGVDDASANIEDLHERASKHEDAQATLQEQGPRHEKATKRIHEWALKRREFFQERGLEPGDDERLSELAQQFQSYDEARSDYEEARTKRKGLAEQLRDHDAFDEEVLTASEEEIARRIEALESKAEEWKKHNDKIQKIKTLIQERKDESDIEEALAGVERARRALEHELEEKQATDVGNLIATEVHEETRDSELPSVFRRAHQILRKVSRRRYELKFDDRADPPQFVAFDNEDGIGKEFHQLSDGTKVQLLLSVRLAFLERQEQGAMVPLILDETLANADEARALAIIQAATELARGGRQVLYLTAQRDEVAKWRSAVDDDEVPLKIVDFGSVTGTGHDGTGLDIDFPGLQIEIPEPEDKDHDAYGRALGVPPVDPLEYYGKAHAWHVVEDPQLLHKILKRGIRAVGPLDSLLDAGAQAAVIPDDETARHVQALIDALKSLVEAARIGRGRPVDRAALEKSGAVSARYIDVVSEMAEDLDGDAEALLAALEDDDRKPNRWQQKKTDELREFLEAEEYLDPLDRLDADGLQARVLSDVSDWIEDDVLSMADVQALIARADGPG